MSFEIFIDGLKILWTTSFESEPEGESETTTKIIKTSDLIYEIKGDC